MLTQKDLDAIQELGKKLETRFTKKNLEAIKKLEIKLTKKNLEAIKKFIYQSFDTKLPEVEKRLVEKNLEAIKLLIEVEFDDQLDKRLKQYFDKDKMYQKLDYIIGKLDTSENERILVVNTQENHEDRLTKLEKIHPQNKHTFAIAS